VNFWILYGQIEIGKSESVDIHDLVWVWILIMKVMWN